MNQNQKLLLVGGIAVLILSILNLSTTGVPNDQLSAILFPLSIIGVFAGLVFIAWAGVSIILDKRS